MKVAELLVEAESGTLKKYLDAFARKLQQKLGAEFATITYKSSAFFGEFLDVQPVENSAATRATVRKEVKALIKAYAGMHMLGVSIHYANIEDGVRLFLQKTLGEATEQTNVAELLTEAAVDKITANLRNWLADKFKTEKGVTFELERIEGLRKMFNIPDDVTQCIRMVVKSRRGLKSARAYLETVIGQRFPEDNILDVVVRMIQTEDGCLIVLQQGLKEVLDPVLAKVYGKIYDIMSGLNSDWWKDFGGKQHYLFDLSANYTDDKLIFRLTRDTNFDFEHFYQGIDYIKEALEEEGLLNGMMPIDIHISKPFGDPVKVEFVVTRSGRKTG